MSVQRAVGKKGVQSGPNPANGAKGPQVGRRNPFVDLHNGNNAPGLNAFGNGRGRFFFEHQSNDVPSPGTVVEKEPMKEGLQLVGVDEAGAAYGKEAKSNGKGVNYSELTPLKDDDPVLKRIKELVASGKVQPLRLNARVEEIVVNGRKYHSVFEGGGLVPGYNVYDLGPANPALEFLKKW